MERNKDGTYNLYEIKSSTKAKKEHEHDLAFQTIVLEKSGLNIKDIFVIHVNNEYVRNGEIDSEKLICITEVTTEVRNIIEMTALNIERARAVMLLTEMPNPSPRFAGSGSLGKWLEIYKLLNESLDPYSIYNLSNPGVKRIAQFEDDGIKLIKDIPEATNLTVKQLGQVVATKSGESIINTEEIIDFLKIFKFPLYFLDYETFSNVIPPFDGTSPYQQIPFQYSLHRLDSPDGELQHTEYLHTKNSLPTRELVKQLQEDIGTEGSVLVWYQSFEKACNTTMAEIEPDYNDFLYGLNERIADLMTPFSEGWYVDKDFFGSASIKAVMPVLVPKLSYNELNIHGGNSAQRIWMQTIFEGRNSDMKEKIIDDLLQYCKLDTLAMVEIWRVLKELK